MMKSTNRMIILWSIIALVLLGCDDDAGLGSGSGGLNDNRIQRDAGAGMRLDFGVLDALPTMFSDGLPMLARDASGPARDATLAPSMDQGMDNGSADATAEPLCLLGERRCNADGAVELCGDEDGDGRVQWIRPMLCPLGQMCRAGQCVGEMPMACKDACEAGSGRCSGPFIERCAAGADGCLTWMQPAPCPGESQCQNGLCQAPDGCVEQCNEGQSLCQGELIRQCRLGAEGCWVLSAPSPCADGLACRLNECRCEGECAVGQRACVGADIEHCVSIDGCGQWAAPEPCAAGQMCANGFCQRPPCEHECIAPGQRDCVGDLQRLCEIDGNLCRVWAEPIACVGGRVCRENGCVFVCDNECELVGTASCQGARDIQICSRDPETQCLHWSFLAQCANGQICREGRCFRAP
jgi:hypothetical protein